MDESECKCIKFRGFNEKYKWMIMDKYWKKWIGWMKMSENGWKQLKIVSSMDENGLPNNAADFVKNVNLVKFLKFGHHSEIQSKFRNVVPIQKFRKNSEIWSKF